MTKDEALRLALEALSTSMYPQPRQLNAIAAIKSALEAKDEPVAWKYDVTYNQDGTVSVALPDGDELRIVLPNQQEPYCWTWDVWVSGGKWRAEYGWKKPTEKVVNLQPLYTTQPQRKPLTDEEIKQSYRLKCMEFGHWLDERTFLIACNWAEAKLKEKNT